MNSDYAPVVIIGDTQGLPDNDRLEATLSCDSPYDVDDNLEDNKATAYFSIENDPVVEQSDIFISIGVAVVVLIVAFFAGVFTQSSSPKPSKKSGQSKPLTTIKPKVTEPEEEEEEMEDEFSFVFDEESTVEVFEEPEEETIVVEQEVIEIQDELDESPSGRLASLRREMGDGDEKSLSREDRMNRLLRDKWEARAYQSLTMASQHGPWSICEWNSTVHHTWCL